MLASKTRSSPLVWVACFTKIQLRYFLYLRCSVVSYWRPLATDNVVFFFVLVFVFARFLLPTGFYTESL